MQKKVSYFSVPITRAVNAVGKSSTTIKLPSEYDRVVGVAILITDITNQNNFKVELTDGNKMLIREVSHKVLLADDSIAPDHKFLSCNFEYIPGRDFYIGTNLIDGAVTGTDLTFDLVLQLTKGGEPFPGQQAVEHNPGPTTDQVVY